MLNAHWIKLYNLYTYTLYIVLSYVERINECKLVKGFYTEHNIRVYKEYCYFTNIDHKYTYTYITYNKKI